MPTLTALAILLLAAGGGPGSNAHRRCRKQPAQPAERPHQGLGNELPKPCRKKRKRRSGAVESLPPIFGDGAARGPPIGLPGAVAKQRFPPIHAHLQHQPRLILGPDLLVAHDGELI